MQIINLSCDDVKNIVANNQDVGRGSYGIIYKINDDILFKFIYKNFIECFSVENRTINLKRLNDIGETIESLKEIDSFMYNAEDNPFVTNIKNLIAKQENIKLIKLPIGLVYCNGYCIGSLLHNHKDFLNMSEYLEKNQFSPFEAVKVSKNLTLATNELIDNHIYHKDFTLRNVMYNPKTQDIQIIDFEDSVDVCEKRCVDLEESVKKRLEINIKFIKDQVETPKGQLEKSKDDICAEIV